MATDTLEIVGCWMGDGGGAAWASSKYVQSGKSSGGNYRTKLAISTEGMTISSSSKLVLAMTVSGISSPIGLECILTQNNDIARNNCQNSYATAASDDLEEAALDRSYAYKDAECTTLLITSDGVNMESGSTFYLLFDQVQFKQDQVYYLYFIRNIKRLNGSYTGTAWVESNLSDNLVVPTLTYTSITACTAPTSLTITPDKPDITTERYEDEIALNWSGAKSGDNNSFTAYELQYSLSNDGDSWDDWTALANVTSRSYTYEPGKDRGTYLKFRIRTLGAAGEAYYSQWFAPDVTIMRNRKPTKPGNLTAESYLITSDGKAKLSWDTSTDEDGDAVSYRAGICLSSGKKRLYDGTTLSCELDINEIAADLEEVTGTEGEKLKFYLYAYDELGARSDYQYADEITINSPPSAPVAVGLSTEEYSPGDYVAVTWSGAEDVDGNLRCYELVCILEDTGAELALDTVEHVEGSADYDYWFIPDQLEYQQKMRIAVRAMDTLGAVSDWSFSTLLFRNDVPLAHIYENGIPGNYIPVVEEARYMPYIRVNDKWIRHPGIR